MVSAHKFCSWTWRKASNSRKNKQPSIYSRVRYSRYTTHRIVRKFKCKMAGMNWITNNKHTPQPRWEFDPTKLVITCCNPVEPGPRYNSTTTLLNKTPVVPIAETRFPAMTAALLLQDLSAVHKGGLVKGFSNWCISLVQCQYIMFRANMQNC